jgi:hypothetical protein
MLTVRVDGRSRRGVVLAAGATHTIKKEP